jgi:hypothetical protein
MRARRVVLGVVVSLAVVLVVPPSVASVAGPEPTWRRFLPFAPRDVVATRGGAAIVVGFTPPNGPPPESLVVAKFAPTGEPTWRRTWSDPGGWGAVGGHVAIAANGDVLVAGDLVEPTLGEVARAHLWRFDPRGRLRWERPIPEAGDVAGLAVVRGRTVVAGQRYLVMAPFPTLDGWLIAFGPGGGVLWRDPFEFGSLRSRDGIGDVGADGTGLFVSGWVRHRVAAGPDTDVVLRRMAADGAILWTDRFPGGRETLDDEGGDVDVVGDRIAEGGFARGQGRRTRSWLGVFTTRGAVRWQRVWGLADDAGWTAAVALAPVGGAAVVSGGGHGGLRGWSATGDLVWETVWPSRGANRLARSDRGLYVLSGWRTLSLVS